MPDSSALRRHRSTCNCNSADSVPSGLVDFKPFTHPQWARTLASTQSVLTSRAKASAKRHAQSGRKPWSQHHPPQSTGATLTVLASGSLKDSSPDAVLSARFAEGAMGGPIVREAADLPAGLEMRIGKHLPTLMPETTRRHRCGPMTGQRSRRSLHCQSLCPVSPRLVLNPDPLPARPSGRARRIVAGRPLTNELRRAVAQPGCTALPHPGLAQAAARHLLANGGRRSHLQEESLL